MTKPIPTKARKTCNKTEETSSTLRADIEWSIQGCPKSKRFDDIYYSPISGIEESQYVFLNQSHLPQRWQTPNQKKLFSIFETGFGTGLNFLCTLKSFIETPNTYAQLQYTAVEKYPLTPSQLQKALEVWPDLEKEVAQLLKLYPQLTAGWHHFSFNNGRVKLTLAIGDAESLVPQIEGKIDAWFLDGFAPAKNPSMWSATLFQSMARLSQKGTTVATFTAAGKIKRALTGAGFQVCKVKGFGNKREMLTGVYWNTQGPLSQQKPKPWLNGIIPQSKAIESAIVVGGGLAGCSAARALAEKGVEVTLLEASHQIANGASGNPQGVIYSNFGVNTPEYNAFYLAGMRLTLAHCKKLAASDFHASGVVQLASNSKELQRQRRLISKMGLSETELRWLSPTELSETFHLTINALGGLWFPQSGWVHPPALCQYLIEHPNIHVEYAQPVEHVQLVEDSQLVEDNQFTSKGWEITTQTRSFTTDALVIANAHLACQLPFCQHLPVKPIAGQITQWSPTANTPTVCQSANTALEEMFDLKTSIPSQIPVLCEKGYLAPIRDNTYCTGASYRINSTELRVCQEEHKQRIEQLADLLPDARLPNPKECQGRVSIRAATPDYWPIVGPLLSPEHFLKAYPKLASNLKHPYKHPANYYPALGVSIGHGSRGLCSTLISGEILACQLTHTPPPASQAVIQHLSPNRFLLKRKGLTN